MGRSLMPIQETTRMLSEHEAKRDYASGPIGYEPTDEEAKTIKMVDHLFQKSKNARKSYDEKWLDNYRMFRGKQWKDARPSFRHSEVINLIFRAIQSEVPILTDAMPKIEFIPNEPQDFEIASILNDVVGSDWDKNNWSYKITECLYDSHIYGTGFGKVCYDEKMDLGMGGIEFTSADPFYQYPDPSAFDINERSGFYIEAEPETLEKLKIEYPEVAQYLKADLQDISKKDKELSDQVRYRSPTDNRTVLEGSSAFDLQAHNEALKICCYVKDTETVQEEMKEADPDSGQETIKYITKLKYPNGRKIVTVSGVLCEDGPLDYEDQKFPYLKLSNYILPREFWGMSEIEQLESPQKIFNKLISFTLDVLTLMGNPIWIVDTSSGVDVENLFFNRPGLIVEKEPNSEVRREEGVQLQPYVLQMIDRMKGWFDDISGSNDVSRGVRPEGVTAASAIEALQTAANTRLRQKSRNLDAFMQNFGQMYLSRVFQYYSAPRVFRITNNQNVTQYFKFHVDKDEKGDKVAKVSKYQQGDDGQYYLDPENHYSLQGRFDVKISTGSSLPFEKSRVEQQTFNLYDRKIIDSTEVLKNLKYPNAEQVTKRMADQAAQLAAQQAPSSVPGGLPPV